MVGESALIPIPSEVVMPFSGYLVSSGKFNVLLVIAAGSLGNLAGSLIAYFVGAYVGRGLVLKYGRYILIRKSHLDIAESYFKKYGDRATFVSRLLPIVRTYVSLPAGTGKMSLGRFSILTLAGSIIWNAALTFIGIKLGQNWVGIKKYSSFFDAIVVIAVIIAIIYYWRKRRSSIPEVA
ncbi:MAG: DedA family protein [Thaumarchaeota archaeon]|nr:DedA family protein [Nitrososphaerota archaeon]